MNFKNGVIKKVACLAMSSTLILGAIPQIIYGQELINPTGIQGYNNIIEIENLIFSEDFENGLQGWIISNPNTNNPRLEVDAQGNHYLRAEGGERANRILWFPANSKIRIYADVAGIPDAVIKVFQLNPGEHQVDIHEARFSSNQMTTIVTEFYTGESTSNFYLSLESQGAPGQSWANFDNIRVYEVIEEIEEVNLLLNGDFSQGLNHWVGEADIISNNGVNHAILSNGAPISQAVRLQPWQNYSLTFSALPGTTSIDGTVLIIGLHDRNPWSFEVLAHESFTNERNIPTQDYIINFNTESHDGVMVLVVPNLNTSYVVSDFKLVQVN